MLFLEFIEGEVIMDSENKNAIGQHRLSLPTAIMPYFCSKIVHRTTEYTKRGGACPSMGAKKNSILLSSKGTL